MKILDLQKENWAIFYLKLHLSLSFYFLCCLPEIAMPALSQYPSKGSWQPLPWRPSTTVCSIKFMLSSVYKAFDNLLSNTILVYSHLLPGSYTKLLDFLQPHCHSLLHLHTIAHASLSITFLMNHYQFIKTQIYCHLLVKYSPALPGQIDRYLLLASRAKIQFVWWVSTVAFITTLYYTCISSLLNICGLCKEKECDVLTFISTVPR